MIKSRRIEPRILYKELVKYIYPKTDDEVTDEEYNYSSIFSLTSALDRGG
jgi:hypothetical protein